MKQYRMLLWVILLALLVAACQGDTEEAEPFVEPPRPSITLNNGEVAVSGVVVNICWPKGVGNISCEPSFGDLEPTEGLPVERDDMVAIDMGSVEVPEVLVVKSPDFEQTIRRGEATEFSAVSLADGRNLLEITAYYTNLAGTEAVVSSVFAVDVGMAVAADMTPTEAPTEIPTETMTPEVTEEPTPTSELAMTGTIEAPATAVDATERPTETSVVDETPMTTESVASPELTEIATEEPQPTPTATRTRRPPTRIPTATATPTSVPTTPPPTRIPTATATPTNTATSTSEEAAFVGAVPDVTLRVGRQTYAPVGFRFCRQAVENQQVCIEQPTGEPTARPRIVSGSAIVVEIGDTRPVSVTYTIVDRDTLQQVSSETRTGDNVLLLSINQPAAPYLLSIDVTWPNRSGTFFYQIQVLE